MRPPAGIRTEHVEVVGEAFGHGARNTVRGGRRRSCGSSLERWRPRRGASRSGLFTGLVCPEPPSSELTFAEASFCLRDHVLSTACDRLKRGLLLSSRVPPGDDHAPLVGWLGHGAPRPRATSSATGRSSPASLGRAVKSRLRSWFRHRGSRRGRREQLGYAQQAVRSADSSTGRIQAWRHRRSTGSGMVFKRVRILRTVRS